jgi:diacylglycerol O-acyltransferase
MTTPLSPADTALLHLDVATHPMMVTGVLSFSAPVDWERVQSVLLERLLQRFPKFGQHIVEPGRGLLPLTAGWRAVEVDPAAHVTRVRLGAPGGDAALTELVGELMSTPLDMERPPWHLHLVDGYEGDTGSGSGPGCAIVARLHHAIADGIALAEVLLACTDDTEREQRTTDSGGGGVLGRIWSSGRRLGTGLLRDPGQLLRLPVEVAGTGATLASLLALPSDPPSAFRGTLHASKKAAWSAPVPLAEIKELARVAGATVNDVLLAVTAGALRRYALEHGAEPVDLRAAIPVNLRLGASPVPRELGNEFGVVVVPLPIGTADPIRRVTAVRKATDELKAGRQALLTYGLLHALGAVPGAVAQQLIDLLGRKCSVIVSNVPGPTEQVRLAGFPVTNLHFWVPQTGGVGIGLSILSYAGSVTLGVVSDAGLVPDADRISDALSLELDELRAALTLGRSALGRSALGASVRASDTARPDAGEPEADVYPSDVRVDLREPQPTSARLSVRSTS